MLRDLDRSEYRNNPTELRDWVAHRKTQIHTASDEFANAKCEFIKLDSIQKLRDLYSAAQTDLARLEAIRACQRAYEAAIAEVRRLEELLQESK